PNFMSLIVRYSISLLFFLFFFTPPPTTDISTLSLHDALPISCCSLSTTSSASHRPAQRYRRCWVACLQPWAISLTWRKGWANCRDRKSTRLNSSHGSISYAVFCLKKKKTTHQLQDQTKQHQQP